MWLMIIMLLHLSTSPSLITNTEANGTKKEVKIAIAVKYLSNYGDL